MTRNRWCITLLGPILLIGFAALVLALGNGTAEYTITDTITSLDAFAYDIDVFASNETISIMVTWNDSDNNIDVYLFNPMGFSAYTAEELDTDYEFIYSWPNSTGTYALIVFGYGVLEPTTYTITSNYPIVKTTMEFSGQLTQHQVAEYNLTIASLNKIVVLRVSWDNTIDEIDVEMFDSSGLQVVRENDYVRTDQMTAVFHLPVETGTYILKIIGSDVVSTDSITYSGTSSHFIELIDDGSDGNGNGNGNGGPPGKVKETTGKWYEEDLVLYTVVGLLAFGGIAIFIILTWGRKKGAPKKAKKPKAAAKYKPGKVLAPQTYVQPSAPKGAQPQKAATYPTQPTGRYPQQTPATAPTAAPPPTYPPKPAQPIYTTPSQPAPGAGARAGVQVGTQARPAPPATALKAPPAAPRQAPVAPPKVEAPMMYLVEEVFVVYHDGRLMSECARDECRTRDADLMSGMLIAIQGFIQDGLHHGGALESVKYGDTLILLGRGDYFILAVVVYGRPDDALKEALESTISRVQASYAGVIEEWTGDLTLVSGIEELVQPLILRTAHLTRDNIARAGEKAGVALLSAADFHRGYVRLKVAAVNATEEAIMDAAMEVHYNPDMLRLERVEPSTLHLRGDSVSIGNVKPGERSTVAFLFDPLICQGTHIDGTLIYYDVRGELHRQEMKRRHADVVCPIFFTREHANTAMLKRLVKEKLHLSDLRIFQYPKDLKPKDVLGIGKLAIGGADVQQVREYIIEGPPFVAEIWYYGETRVKGYQIVMRLGVLEEKGALELYCASTAMEPITGLLAEFRRDLNRVLLENYRGDGRMEAERDEQVRQDLSTRALLIDKIGEGEIEAGDIT